MLLTNRIREEAGLLGFFKMGVARAAPLPGSERLDTWLDVGMHGEMSYMARQAARRCNPGLVLEQALIQLATAFTYDDVKS